MVPASAWAAVRARTLRANVGIVLDRLTRVAAMYQAQGVLRDDVPPDKIARVLAALMQGFILQLTILEGVVDDDFRAGIRGLLRSTPVPESTP